MTNNSKAFCEDYTKGIKIKSAVFLIFYILFRIFDSSIITQIDNKTVETNSNFFGYLFLFIVVIILFFTTLRQSVSSIKISFNKNLNYLIIIFFITITLMVIAAICLFYSGVNDNNEVSLEKESEKNMLLFIIMAVIFGPLVEELIFRFIIFRSISNKSIVLACVISSIIFGFYHFTSDIIVNHDYSQFAAMLPTTIMGLGFSTLYAKTKNLAYPIFMHMAVNFIASTN